MFERFAYLLNTLYCKSLDIPFLTLLSCQKYPSSPESQTICCRPFLLVWIQMFERFHVISERFGFFVVVIRCGLVFEYISRTSTAKRAQRACITSSVYSYLRSILTAVMPGAVLHGYRVAGNRWHNNRWLALWSRYNAGGGGGFHNANILVIAFNSNNQLKDIDISKV